jgi:hypothetical protein
MVSGTEVIPMKKRYCAYCQAAVFGRRAERCPLCGRKTARLGREFVPVKQAVAA